MKKTISLCLFSIIAISATLIATSSSELLAYIVPFRIIVNDEIKTFSNPIVTINDRTYLPVREIAEAIGCKVEWDSNTQTVQVDSGKNTTSDAWLIYKENDKYGYMDIYGNVKIPPQYDYAFSFCDGVAFVGNRIYVSRTDSGAPNALFRLIKEDGSAVTELKYTGQAKFSNGLALVHDINGDSYYIDKNGTTSDFESLGVDFFTTGVSPKIIAGTTAPIPDPIPQVWSYIDCKGNVVTDKEYEHALPFENGLAIAKQNGKYGIINTHFENTVDFLYEDLDVVGTDLFAAKKDGSFGLIDSKGNILVPFTYFLIGKDSDGIIDARYSVNSGTYIDKAGNTLFDKEFSMVYPFVGRYACVVDKATDTAGVIDRQGNYVIEPNYYWIRPTKAEDIFEVRDRDSLDSYYINIHGEKISPKR